MLVFHTDNALQTKVILWIPRMKFKSNKITQYLYERKSTDGQEYILNHGFDSSGLHKRVKGFLKKK